MLSCRSKRTALAFYLIAGFGCGSSEPEEPSEKLCTELRDHLVELRVGSLTGPRATSEVLASHRASLEQALGERFVSSCQSTMTSREVNCALKASDLDRALRCQIK